LQNSAVAVIHRRRVNAAGIVLALVPVAALLMLAGPGPGCVPVVPDPDSVPVAGFLPRGGRDGAGPAGVAGRVVARIHRFSVTQLL